MGTTLSGRKTLTQSCLHGHLFNPHDVAALSLRDQLRGVKQFLYFNLNIKGIVCQIVCSQLKGLGRNPSEGSLDVSLQVPESTASFFVNESPKALL